MQTAKSKYGTKEGEKYHWFVKYFINKNPSENLTLLLRNYHWNDERAQPEPPDRQRLRRHAVEEFNEFAVGTTTTAWAVIGNVCW